MAQKGALYMLPRHSLAFGARKLCCLLLVGATGCAARAAETPTPRDNLRLALARTYVRNRAFGAALPLLQQAVTEQPGDAELRTLYGVILRERGMYAQAEAQLRAALAADAAFAAAHAALGIVYDLEGRPADAEREHRRAVTLAPQQAAYWNDLGFSLLVAGRVDEAISALERTVALDPGLIVAHNNLGFAYGKRGDYARSLRSFRVAVGEAGAARNLALVYERNGELEAAARLRATTAEGEEEKR
jgi:Flp pilus assembly protein TadD